MIGGGDRRLVKAFGCFRWLIWLVQAILRVNFCYDFKRDFQIGCFKPFSALLSRLYLYSFCMGSAFQINHRTYQFIHLVSISGSIRFPLTYR